MPALEVALTALGVAVTQLFEPTFVRSDVVRAARNGLVVGAATSVGIKSVGRAGSSGGGEELQTAARPRSHRYHST